MVVKMNNDAEISRHVIVSLINTNMSFLKTFLACRGVKEVSFNILG